MWRSRYPRRSTGEFRSSADTGGRRPGRSRQPDALPHRRCPRRGAADASMRSQPVRPTVRDNKLVAVMKDREPTVRSRELGDGLRRAMEYAGYNGTQIADELGWSQGRVSRLLAGKR